MSRLNFQLERVAEGSKARAGVFTTLHNVVETPTFMPVGTHATIRTQRLHQVATMGAQVILGNTYHLMLRPGPELFESFGGIHKFIRWPKSVLTDSGGFQIFCRPDMRMIGDQGAEFQNYVNGQRILLTPERSIAMQRSIGSDIMMVLDECVPSTVDEARARDAMERTHRWAVRSFVARGESEQALFGIIQGACYPNLRKESAAVLGEMEFDGMAVGGLAVGESAREREDTTEMTTELMPVHRPRYLMGVGTPLDLLEAVHRGIDMFDCILPTALAQQGIAFTWHGKMDFRRTMYRTADEKIDASCECETCLHYSRAYLHHLVKVKDFLVWQLLGTHNIYFYLKLMRTMRAHILAGTFAEFYRIHRQVLGLSDGPGEKPPLPRTKKAPPPMALGRFEIGESQGRSVILERGASETSVQFGAPLSAAAEKRFLEQVVGRQDEKGMVVWDVGMGDATRVMAIIRCYETLAQTQSLRPLKIISFEHDLDALRLALAHPRRFEHLKHGAPYSILETGAWVSKDGCMVWEVKTGPLQEERAKAPSADITLSNDDVGE